MTEAENGGEGGREAETEGYSAARGVPVPGSKTVDFRLRVSGAGIDLCGLMSSRVLVL